MSSFIQLSNVSKIYQGKRVDTHALSNIDLRISQGEFVAVMGASGSGKSSLLHMLGMLDLPSTGEYFFQNADVKSMTRARRAAFRKYNIGFVFQDFNLIEDINVFDNVELPLLYLKVKKHERTKTVEQILKRLGLMHKADEFPESLSGGQQQRVAVARAMVAKPKLILADEPTGNLDTEHGNEVMEMLSELNQQGTTVVMVTHNFNDAAYAKRLIKLLDGQIISENVTVNVA